MQHNFAQNILYLVKNYLTLNRISLLIGKSYRSLVVSMLATETEWDREAVSDSILKQTRRNDRHKYGLGPIV